MSLRSSGLRSLNSLKAELVRRGNFDPRSATKRLRYTDSREAAFRNFDIGGAGQ
jgi:hypothetical protein